MKGAILSYTEVSRCTGQTNAEMHFGCSATRKDLMIVSASIPHLPHVTNEKQPFPDPKQWVK
jgi:hypothetical protein